MASTMKYAHVERERRYLLLEENTLLHPLRELDIHDLYLINTNLRLRKVEEAGQPTNYKLGQKIRVGTDIEYHVAHTTMYISAEEFDLLVSLPTYSLEKRRSIYPLENFKFGIDVFGGELQGLTMIEIDLGKTEVLPPPLPLDSLIEVTADERFTGGSLVKLKRQDLKSLLNEFGVS